MVENFSARWFAMFSLQVCLSSTRCYLFNLYSILCFTNLHRYLCFDILQVEQMRLRQSRNMRDCI